MNEAQVRIKICCIMNETDLSYALSQDVDAVGFVSNMPSGPGVISEGTIKKLVDKTPKNKLSFLLTSLTSPTRL